MNSLNLGESTDKYSLPLERALNHPYSAVKLMALNEIQRNVSNEEPLLMICKRLSLLKSIIKCLGDSDITVAKRASDIIVALGLFSPGLKQLVSNDIMTALHEVMSISEVVRLRVYEVRYMFHYLSSS